MGELEKRTLFERLTEDQKARLQKLSSEITHEKLTIAFSLDERDPNGRKQSSFYSTTVTRKCIEPDGVAVGFNHEDARLVRLLVSKQVVSIVYDDAVKRRMLTAAQAANELRPILEAYDAHIAKVMGEGSPSL